MSKFLTGLGHTLVDGRFLAMITRHSHATMLSVSSKYSYLSSAVYHGLTISAGVGIFFGCAGGVFGTKQLVKGLVKRPSIRERNAFGEGLGSGNEAGAAGAPRFDALRPSYIHTQSEKEQVVASIRLRQTGQWLSWPLVRLKITKPLGQMTVSLYALQRLLVQIPSMFKPCVTRRHGGAFWPHG